MQPDVNPLGIDAPTRSDHGRRPPVQRCAILDPSARCHGVHGALQGRSAASVSRYIPHVAHPRDHLADTLADALPALVEETSGRLERPLSGHDAGALAAGLEGALVEGVRIGLAEAAAQIAGTLAGADSELRKDVGARWAERYAREPQEPDEAEGDARILDVLDREGATRAERLASLTGRPVEDIRRALERMAEEGRARTSAAAPNRWITSLPSAWQTRQ